MRFRRSLAVVGLAVAGCARGGRSGPPEAPTRATSTTDGDSVEIVVASTTDVHGRLRAWDYYVGAADTLRGLARAATIVDSVRTANPGRVVLVDAGDALQGNPLTYVAARLDTTAPHPVIAAMNAMRYDAMAVGNHDFNYGIPLLQRAIAGANFPILASNVYTKTGSRFLPALRILERAGVRVAVIGATTPGAMIWDRANLEGRVTIRDIVSELRGAVAEARTRSDAVVIVMHSGLGGPSSYDEKGSGVPPENVAARVAREVPGVDLIVFGHSHREVADTVINGVMLVQPRNWATSVSVASLRLTRTQGRWQVTAKHGTLVRAAGHAESPAVVSAVERAHQATLDYVGQTLGTTTVSWRADSARVADVALTDFLLEVERQVTGADLAATPAYDLGVSISPGPITVAQVARLYPYDNTLRAIRITGRQLRDYLEFSAKYFRQ
ncbi:MAG: 5'-nucleotidase C-terminal domain-containing protein, partial [Gemmatimonadaceae bacterium]